MAECRFAEWFTEDCCEHGKSPVLCSVGKAELEAELVKLNGWARIADDLAIQARQDKKDLDALESRLRDREAACAKMREALDKAAYALFQIKRMVPDAIREFASQEHSKACEVLDSLDIGLPGRGRNSPR